MKVFEILECRVCGHTSCNCTHIVESQDFANMSNDDLKRYVDRHVKNGIAHELSKDAKAKLKAAQQELNRRTNLSEGEAERKTNATWAQITDYEKRAKSTKDPIKKDHYTKMARELREKLPTNEGYAPQGGNYKQGKYHVVVAGKCISEHNTKSEASSAAAKYRKANPSSQPRVKHESELTEGLADEIANKAMNDRLSKMSQEEKVKGGWAHPSTIKGPSAAERKKSRDAQRSSTAKKARVAERRKGV